MSHSSQLSNLGQGGVMGSPTFIARWAEERVARGHPGFAASVRNQGSPMGSTLIPDSIRITRNVGRSVGVRELVWEHKGIAQLTRE